MSFPAISSRDGLTATNSTRLNINNILCSSCMSQDGILNLDNRAAAAEEFTRQELEGNKRRKQDEAAALSR